MVERPRWDGRTVVCIASGPSLTPEDCEVARAAAHPVIVTNTTFRLCPWADVLYGFDAKWWKAHHGEVQEKFGGQRLCGTQVGEKYGARWLAAPWFRAYRNSGACAASLALAGGAAKVVLLGYDAGFMDGKAHWHEDHPKGLENATSIADWPRQFALLAKDARRRGVPVVNASRRTRLECFPRAELRTVL